MLAAARQMADIVSNPKQLNQERPTPEAAAPFNLQHLMREAHDAVAPAAESAGIGLPGTCRPIWDICTRAKQEP